MSHYERILEVTRSQAEAARAGDLERAVALLDVRSALIAEAPAPGPRDQQHIRSVLELDKDIATAIRYRMLAIRDQALASRQGQQALAGYAGAPRRGSRILEWSA